MRDESESEDEPEMDHALVAKKWSAPPRATYDGERRSERSAASIRERCVVPLQSPM